MTEGDLLEATALEKFANLIGQPVEEVGTALRPGETIKSLTKKNKEDIKEAREFRGTLRAIGEKGEVKTVFYPGAGADLIPDEILGEGYFLPVYKTSLPSELGEYCSILPDRYCDNYFPAIFGSIQLPVKKVDLIILRNIPDLPGLFEDVERYSRLGTLLIVFEKEFVKWCVASGFENITKDYAPQNTTKLSVFRVK